MAYVPSPADVNAVRIEVADTEVGLFILPDSTYEYILTKNSGSIGRSSVDAARMILMRLSITAKDQVVDVLSIKTSKQAEAYRQALILFITNPSLNPLLQNVQGWAGGISLSEMQANNANPDNNVSSLAEITPRCYPNDNPFAV